MGVGVRLWFMSGAIPLNEPFGSEICDELDRIREKRLSYRSKKSDEPSEHARTIPPPIRAALIDAWILAIVPTCETEQCRRSAAVEKTLDLFERGAIFSKLNRKGDERAILLRHAFLSKVA
jgi:hypothetical protein